MPVSNRKGLCCFCGKIIWFDNGSGSHYCPCCNTFNAYEYAKLRYINSLNDQKEENRKKIAAETKKPAESPTSKTYLVVLVNGVTSSSRFTYYTSARNLADYLKLHFEKVEIVQYKEETVSTEISREVIRDAN